MLRQLFPRGYRCYVESRYASDLEDFNSWLEATGYGRGCIRGHVFRLKRSLERIPRAAPGSAYTVAQLHRAFGADCSAPKRTALYRATQCAYQRFLVSRQRLVRRSVEEPFAPLRDAYRWHLVELRGLTAETVAQHERTVGEFLHRLLPLGESLDTLTPARIEQFLAFTAQHNGRGRQQHIVAHLRAFLCYCHHHHAVTAPLPVIDTPRLYQAERPPRALVWSLVTQLLRSIDRSSRSGWRDSALLHLLAYYGLRPSEAVTLTLDTIDWHAGTLTVAQRKTRSTLLLPLGAQTVSLLRRYLAHGRAPSPHHELFLRARSPSGPLTRHAVSDIFEKRVAQSALPINGHSVYCLRHSFALRLLTRGVGLKAIGDLLGHRSLQSTCEYLRLDVEMLRVVALPVPTYDADA